MKPISEHQTLTICNSIEPLVITPSPREGEALSGFILRTAEMNGYNSPIQLLHYAGMDDNEARSARPPLAKLVRLYGKTAAEPSMAGLDSHEPNHTGRYLQVMGQAIPSMFTRSKQAGFCLSCVQEKGFIDGFHELKYAVACPQHTHKTIQACPVCHKKVSWQRLGLTRCSCGFDLAETTPAKVDHPAVLALLGILNAKLMRQALDKVQIETCGFPYAAMEQLSIQTLLSMIYRFGLFNSKTKDSSADDGDWMAVQTTAEALSDWPHRFYDYIEQTHAPTANLKVSGLRGQFNSFYESFFKNIAQDQELEFMRDAFISFGQQRWKKAALDPKRKDKAQSNVVGINGLAKVTNIHPHTLRGLVAKGLIEISGRSDTTQPRDVFDLTRQQRFEFAQGKNLSVKIAAEILDIPVDVLRAYRAQGLYQARYLAIPVVLFHERDVEHLKQQLMQDCGLSKVYVSKQHVTLAEVMRMKLSAEIKALFIAAVKERSIKPVAKFSEQVSGLIFDAASTKKYLLQLKQTLGGGASFEEAKSSLKVERDVLFALVKADLLQCIHSPLGMCISEQSLITFQDQYISCQEVARLKGITQRYLVNLCNVLGVSQFKLAGLKSEKRNIFWLEKQHLALLGIHGLEERFAEAA